MDPAELRDLGADDLMKRLQSAQQELLNLRLRVAGQTPKTTRIRELRRDVAQLKTVLYEKGVKV